LIEDIRMVAQGDSGLASETRAAVAKLTKPIRIQVFSTPT